jgi:hypothetical protein
VEFDEIDLNERQMSVRSRDKFNNNVNGHCPPQANQKPAEDTIHVTGLMLDQLYEDDEKVEEKTQNDDQVSREIVEVSKLGFFAQIFAINSYKFNLGLRF